MAELLHEIWEDVEECSFTLLRVSQHSDYQINEMSPNATVVHSFTAESDHQAFQKNYDWHGWGKWKPEPDWDECFFSEEEAEEQRSYIAVRVIK